jgi:hypothetical protein
MKYCVKCGAELADEAHFCPKCGAEQPTASDYAAEGASQETASQPIQPEPVKASSSASSSPSDDSTPMVLGILSIVLAGVVGLILGIIGIQKSTCSRDHTLNLVGIVISSIVLAFAVIYLIIFFIALASGVNYMSSTIYY